MAYLPENPLVVQSDRTILLEVDNPLYPEARDALARFAELVKSPEHIHTYRLTSLSLWNAAASGLDAATIIQVLDNFSKYPLPANVVADIREYVGRYGKVKLMKQGNELYLVTADPVVATEIINNKRIQPYIKERRDACTLAIEPWQRGPVKQALIKIGYPVEDLAGYVSGAPLPFSLRGRTLSGEAFSLRPYQAEAAQVFFAGGSSRGGSGVIVLPCGAGKTIVGLAAMALCQCYTLILVTSVTAARQWLAEIRDKTDLPADLLGEYSGEKKEIKPVTVATYQIITHRRRRNEDYPNFQLFNQQDWGLIIYDEVHLLPAPVFRITAELQARRRLGLTATLIREDGHEDDVFSLIGPKKYDLPWKQLEAQGWIAKATCYEVRLNLPPEAQLDYAVAGERDKYRIAATNAAKEPIVEAIIRRHEGEQVLVIGQYLEQLERLARRLEAPIITGKTGNRERERLYQAFREGTLKCLVVSKVANFAIDLPEASVAIQVSGTFGSRQEEAQRLGRILRPKKRGLPASFYSLVTRETVDQEFAVHRQLFLTEQGYRYEIVGPDLQPEKVYSLSARREKTDPGRQEIRQEKAPVMLAVEPQQEQIAQGKVINLAAWRQKAGR
ncbi:Helicase Ercc3 [Moorella glycerini]|uniref:DNA 3'-5' helicase n=1 Tax=Neomoorella stamsii TaxID=1266720 RepID=A0A9X7J612_9FIRM|nr:MULTISPECIES: DNA repair helicase XPB [Moorella]PRR77574.1 Type III restriction enzyme, res subunit [Moorella stamsii]CEP69379.1 Helicase Ercc3 [Moorella glycerini]